MHLTKRTIDAVKFAAKNRQRHVLWDEQLPGFGLRVYPNDRKVFVLSYRIHGRKRLITIGKYGVYTLDQARALARSHLVDLNLGTDPLEIREQSIVAQNLAELCEAYMSRHAKVHKKTWRDDQQRIEKYLLPDWGKLRATALKRMDVAALHNRVGKSHPYAANRIVELVSKMFELAKIWGIVPDDHPNPARGIQPFKETKRDRWVTPQELPRLAKAINEESNLYARNALWLYLFTGVRKSELLRTRWSDIDWDRAELRIPETKAGRTHYLPLSPPAMKLLQDLPRQHGNPYVFPGVLAGRHLVNVEKAWRRVRKAAGIPDVRLHDLRRTVGSWLAQAGNSLHLIGRVLNHSTPSTTAVYARFGQDHVRQALDDHGKRIAGIAGFGTTAHVIALRPELPDPIEHVPDEALVAKADSR